MNKIYRFIDTVKEGTVYTIHELHNNSGWQLRVCDNEIDRLIYKLKTYSNFDNAIEEINRLSKGNIKQVSLTEERYGD